MHAVSLPPFLFCSTADDGSLSPGSSRRAMTSWRSYVSAAPDRLLGLGYVPIGWPGAADEARRALDDLGLAGIAIGSRGGGKDLDDPINDDLWALLAERARSSSCTPAASRRRAVEDFWMPQLVGYPMETAIAVARLVFGGVLERTRSTCAWHTAAVVCRRCGAEWTWVGNRKDVAHTTAVPPSEFTDRLYYDTAVFNSDAAAPDHRGRRRRARHAGHRSPLELGDFTPRRRSAARPRRRRQSRVLWDNAGHPFFGLPVAAR